ncbi:hypothetical protein ABT340_04850 [Streptosporangium sp. NPDC000239]|uniref:hypothetical protein n=1 Tax=Streptosporangium sp. NPDC000239 TaxID=3154248 RepID=UPI003329BCE1
MTAVAPLMLAVAAALLGVAAARRGRWLHATCCGVACLLAVYVGLLVGLSGVTVLAAAAVPGRPVLDARACGAVSPHGDVCVREEGHLGLCRSVGRKHVSSPEKAGKPWRWYRSDDPAVAAELSRKEGRR